MTQKDKQLLIKDLCARLLYGVQGITSDGVVSSLIVKGEADWDIITSLNYRIVKHGWKPYLRPMSSMTDEERKELMDLCDITPYETQGLKIDEYGAGVFLNGICSVNNDVFDWLNAHHFDFRNLISKGLAIDCTDLNIY